MASVHSASDASLLAEAALDAGVKWFWTGGVFDGDETGGIWSWTDGSVFGTSYENWMEGEVRKVNPHSIVQPQPTIVEVVYPSQVSL